MARPTPTPNLTRRTVLAGGAALAGATALPGMAFASAPAAAASVSTGQAPSALCLAHHRELSNHLRTILNSAYVDAQMKNKVLATAQCPHCSTGIRPADMPLEQRDRAAFSVIA